MRRYDVQHVDSLIIWAGVAVTLAVIDLLEFAAVTLRAAPLGRLTAAPAALATATDVLAAQVALHR